MSDIVGELHGITYNIQESVITKLNTIGIDAVKEIEAAIEIHVNTHVNLIKGETNELNTK